MHSQLLLVASLANLAISATTNTNLQTTFPKPSGTTALAAVRTIAAGQTFDGGMKQWDRSPSTCNDQAEGGDADAVFLIQSGGTLSNVVIGPNNSEGVHCLGPCTLNNVWWTDVCEDAATFKQTSGTSYVNGGGARNADDKILQHNGGGLVAVKNFYAENSGKLYRSCGNCEEQPSGGRKSSFENIRLKKVKVAAGVNGNLGDTTSIKNSCILEGAACWLYKGVTDGEPTKTASGPDGKTCATSSVKLSGC